MDDSQAMRMIGQFVTPLVKHPDTTPSDILRLADALIAAAEEIYLAVTNNQITAARFYSVADRLAVKP